MRPFHLSSGERATRSTEYPVSLRSLGDCGPDVLVAVLARQQFGQGRMGDRRWPDELGFVEDLDDSEPVERLAGRFVACGGIDVAHRAHHRSEDGEALLALGDLAWIAVDVVDPLPRPVAGDVTLSALQCEQELVGGGVAVETVVRRRGR